MQFDTKKGTGEYIKPAANTRGSTVGCIADNRPQTIVQRKQLAGMQPASEKLSAEHAAEQAVAETLQMKQTATPPKTIQLQKAQGRYRVRTNANLRNNNDAHTVLKVIQRGSEVTVIDKGRRQSNFKAGWVTNEHSWVRDGEDFSQEGWIEDGKLQPLEGRSVGLLGSDTDYRSDPSPFEVQPHFFETANDLPHPGDRVSMSDWTNYEGYQLQNKYPVFFREVHSGGNPEVQFIAVDTSSGMVVASSGASFKKGKGSDHEDYIKAFSSHPPFAGLGGHVLAMLKRNYSTMGRGLRPEFPSPGAYFAYSKMGYLNLENDQLPESIKGHIGEAKQILARGDLKDERTRTMLTQTQKKIVNVEGSMLLNRSLRIKK